MLNWGLQTHMKAIFLALPFLLISSVQAEGLDDAFHLIKPAGGLTNLCANNPEILECKLAIGKWKPQELERVKSMAPYCYEQCEYDQYGFVKSSAGGPEFPMVVTKDFDGSSASRGVEFFMFPVALKAYKYDGCVGCSLTKMYPNRVDIVKRNSQFIQLPRLSRGTFYMTSEARDYAMQLARTPENMLVRLSFNKEIETRRISKAALRSYSTMLSSLKYDLVQ